MNLVRSLILLLILIANPLHAETPIDFNRDIRPILSDACFHCHGPDKTKRKADLQLDTPEGAFEDRDGMKVIVAGHPEKSLAMERMLSKDPLKQMPPPSAKTPLKKEQIEILRRWIAEGAKYQKHWAFLPPVKTPPPKVKDKAWPRHALDHFVLHRLEKEGLKPSPEADRTTLIRRVSFDLTGLPPTPEDVEAFVNDKSANAYEKVVDRLLKSPRYGERMAHRWLDAARYADTNGYQNDGPRTMWRWRDWVIEAFNKNMPFDQFTIEQLAGDLLPNATLEQKIATGFNRNHRQNSEGGVIPEEYAVEYVVDRVDTTSTVWLGLTMGCARCHNHKYDPLTQKEFYQLFAFFNNIAEKGKAIKYGNSPPVVLAPTKEQEKMWADWKRRVKVAEIAFAELKPRIEQFQRTWEISETKVQEPWAPSHNLVRHWQISEGSRGGLEGLTFLGKGEDSGDFFNGHRWIEAGKVAGFSFFERFTMGAWVRPADPNAGSILSKVENNDRAAGYNLLVKDGKLHLHFAKRWLDDAIRVETVHALKAGQWQHVMFTYDASRLAQGITIYVDGVSQQLKINLDDLNQDITTDEPLRIGADLHGSFRGGIDDVRIYRGVLTPLEVAAAADKTVLLRILDIPEKNRTAAQALLLRTFFLEEAAPPEIRKARQEFLAAREGLQKFEDSLPTSMVMAEMPTPRPTHILLRGEYDKLGPRVSPGLPEALPPLPKNLPHNRLGLAKWLVQRDNPLTARVAVNRFWQMLLGTGIVKSVEDFGAQGEWPSHPELLDGLAVEFMENGWDVHKLLKTIVTSATYRQSSKVRPELLAKDPENRLLGRGPRIRLSAEMIRDQALAASGLLVEKVGGPSVKPYQPAGLAKELHGIDEDGNDHGESLYRRSLYTYWKRTVAPPSLMTFDAANRETCVVRESRTNTPLQALNLMNDVTFVEAARTLAQRVMKEAKGPDRVVLAFRLVASRAPSNREVEILTKSYQQHRQHYQKDSEAALKLLSVGESPRDTALDAADHAALTALANTLFNLDEVITKE